MTLKLYICLIFLSVSALAPSEAEIKAELVRHRTELARLSEEKANIADFLDGLYREKALISELQASLTERQKQLDVGLAELSDSLEIARVRLDSAIVLQEKVVRAMFMTGRGEDISFILGADDFGEFVRRIDLFGFLAVARVQHSQEIRKGTLLVASLVDSIQSVRDSVRVVRSLKEAELDSLTKIEAKQKSALEAILNDETAFRSAIARMEESLAELARRLPAPSLEGDFARHKGTVPWPTNSRRIIHNFGIVSERRFGTTFKNAGIDIATAPNESIFAVAEGVVAQVYWLRAYGNIVIIEHGGGFFTVYGNLGNVEVAVRQKVSGGQQIGRTAREGWLEGSKLHFEIRKGRQEVNPLEWLVSA